MSDAALPEAVLLALTTIDNHINELPSDDRSEILEIKAIASRLKSLLIQYSSKRHIRYPLEN